MLLRGHFPSRAPDLPYLNQLLPPLTPRLASTDDIEYGFDENDSNKLDHYGRVLLHGNGDDRWFDKSFNLCFSTNGSVCRATYILLYSYFNTKV